MRKYCFLLFLGIILSGCGDKNKYEVVYESDLLKIFKISDHIYLHESYLDTESFGRVSCNGVIYADSIEAAVFDTPVDDVSSLELINWVENQLGKKIVVVVPLHYHSDNLGGLNAFHQHEIASLAYRRTLELAREHNMPIPNLTFDPKVEITVEGVPMAVEFFGEGHTADNVVLYIPSEKMLFGGCLVKALGADKGNLTEANEEAWSESVRKVKAKYPEVQIVIPGHGKPGGVELLDYTIELFEE
ncbi:subclass B1 metallo-beta-lactamase [Bacteroidales bacterium OttesenSCG-928-B11]|nr:subclass B1 metallo-beta-lactamase [Bacteroidales bacterium OttesenSCG-928-E04]MDL2311929.1 subclass B1 metallo-beta-lactamase [Bacteroidales bacterium OttesenSCG-928-B11]